MQYPAYTNPYRGMGYSVPQYSTPMSQSQYQQPVVPRTPAQPITSPQIPSLFGRMINDISEVTPQEVPMNGAVSFFPTNDYTAVFAKCWSPDGTIQTFKFIPEQQTPPEPQEDPFKKLNDRLDKIEELIGNKFYNKNVTRNNNKRNFNNQEESNNGD